MADEYQCQDCGAKCEIDNGKKIYRFRDGRMEFPPPECTDSPNCGITKPSGSESFQNKMKKVEKP